MKNNLYNENDSLKNYKNKFSGLTKQKYDLTKYLKVLKEKRIKKHLKIISFSKQSILII